MKLFLAVTGLGGLFHLLSTYGSASAAAVLTGAAATVLVVIAGLMRDA